MIGSRLSALQNLPPNAKTRFPALTHRVAAEHTAADGITSMPMADGNEHMNKLSTLLNLTGLESGCPANRPVGSLRSLNHIAARQSVCPEPGPGRTKPVGSTASPASGSYRRWPARIDGPLAGSSLQCQLGDLA